MNNNLENVTNKKDSKSNTWVIYTLVFLGSLDALYLTWTKVLSVDTLCLGTGKCDVVNASSYSTIAGVPIAALGLAMY
ncbi:MAG: vitamin K epoxide reductase family protein, partial [Anaerolineales bacterium]|nr:vitamin K epoxide reductase family protein [Anaerolineales bacterium]